MTDDQDFSFLLSLLPPEDMARLRSEAVKRLVANGWTLQAIADRLGVTKSAVSNWVNRQ